MSGHCGEGASTGTTPLPLRGKSLSLRPRRQDRCGRRRIIRGSGRRRIPARPSTAPPSSTTDAGSGTEPDDFAFKFRLFHGLTPETETSCHYFWSAANGYRRNEPEATEQLYREIAPTFLEDQEMVEAQQARLTEFGESGLPDIASDSNRMQIRRHVDRLIAAEREAVAAD